jgi:hypothetical protein
MVFVWICVASSEPVKDFWYAPGFTYTPLWLSYDLLLCRLHMNNYDSMNILLQVGSFAVGLFLIHSECLESNYIASRLFHVNVVSCCSVMLEVTFRQLFYLLEIFVGTVIMGFGCLICHSKDDNIAIWCR